MGFSGSWPLVSGADPGFFLGGSALVSCSTSAPNKPHTFFFAEYQKTAGHLVGGRGGGGHTLHPPPRSALESRIQKEWFFFTA